MGQTQSNNKIEKIKNYKNNLKMHLQIGKDCLLRSYEHEKKPSNRNKKNILCEGQNINISNNEYDEYKKNSKSYLISKIIEHDKYNKEQVRKNMNELENMLSEKDTNLKKKELLINILYLHEIRITFYELLNSEIVNVLIKKGLLRGGLQNNNVKKINLKGMNEVIYLKGNKDNSVKDIFKMIKKTVLEELSKDKFLLVKNDKTIYDYLVLEMHEKGNEILKRPTVLDTISILKELSDKLLKNSNLGLNNEEQQQSPNDLILLLETGEIKEALDDYYQEVLHKNKKTRINNLVKAGDNIMKEIEEKLKEIKPNSPRVVSEVHTGGVNKSKINKQDSIKKMKLKQQKEMNKLKLKQKNELLKLKNKQKKELKSKSKKSTNKCCNCKKNFSSKSSLTNHKKKCN